jgi:small-conductance mechanosensitive channel
MDEFLKEMYWGNTVLAYLIAVGGIIVAWVILKLVKKRLIRLLKDLTSRTATNIDDVLIDVTEKFIIPYIYLSINYAIITQLVLSPRISRILTVAMLFVSTWYAIRLINFLIQYGVKSYMARRNEPPERAKQLNGILLVVKALVWIFGIVVLIDNLGYNVTTIIAGLGVGGIAIALAAQNILSDLFSYLVIFFDKPFEVGDFIITNGNFGSVEKIGIKTSHLRSPDGQQLVMPNAELVKSVIHNYKRMQRRRVVFKIGVVYATPSDKLRKIPEWSKEIISTQAIATFDRTHFVSFGDSSLNYEIVYFINSTDFLVYMDTHHDVCLRIFEKFEKEQVEFAYPTQTVFVNRQDLKESEVIGDETQ